MSSTSSFIDTLEKKVRQQFASQNVGYLLGAGASYLDGNGFPLSEQLWAHIAPKIQDPERSEIQAKLDNGATGIENALDLLDDGSATEKPHRHLVIEAIAECFKEIAPPEDFHKKFVRRIATRNEISVPLFCLNYDCLIELASDSECVRVVDGFLGLEKPFFAPQIFQEHFAISHRGPRKPQADWRKGIIHLYKLHGSLGWFQLDGTDVRKLGHKALTPTSSKRLMIPPQYRKASDTTSPPYSALWSDFRGLLCQGPSLLNRLVTIGYGMRDEHLNTVIDNALARSNFILIILTKQLTQEDFTRWSPKPNVIIITDDPAIFN